MKILVDTNILIDWISQREGYYQNAGEIVCLKDISKDPRPYSKIITVNSETYDSYETAFIDIDKNVERYTEVMTND